tara:strand:- start:27975 stop:28748 length:774 start_codon:yes stop_codon:yes gene_type:complete
MKQKSVGLFTILLATVAIGIIMSASTGYAADIPKSFPTSVKWMVEDIHKPPLNQTFYCGCAFKDNKSVDYSDCDYQPVNINGTRANRIEAEHAMPAAMLGGGLMCWGDTRKDIPACYESDGDLLSSRACCEKTNMIYERAQNDLVNLVPAIGELNNLRSDKLFSNIHGEGRDFGSCDVEVNQEYVEVRDVMRGDVARIFLYMLDAYSLPLDIVISDKELMHLYYWDLKDPVSDDERLRNQRICEKQGSGNHYVGECE